MKWRGGAVSGGWSSERRRVFYRDEVEKRADGVEDVWSGIGNSFGCVALEIVVTKVEVGRKKLSVRVGKEAGKAKARMGRAGVRVEEGVAG